MRNSNKDAANRISRFRQCLTGDRYNLYLVILLAVFAIFQLVRNIWMGVHIDEANWWMQTKHLTTGYFFHPPFIVYQQFVITSIFGDSPLALRLGSIFFTTLNLFIVFILVKEMFGNTKLAFYSALLIAILPITMYWMVIGFQDPPFFFFFLLSILLVWRAVDREKRGYWYLAGISAGFMLLCKLEAALFFVGLLLFLLSSRPQRRWLRTKEPYLGFLIVVVMFSPTIAWYASRGFEPITYQLTNRPGFLEFGLINYIIQILKHIGWEMAVLSYPVYLLSLFGLIYGGYRGLKGKDTRFQLLFWISVVYIVIFGVTTGPPYWPYPGYALSVIAAVCAFPLLLAGTTRKLIHKYWRPAFALCLAYALIASLVGIYLYTTSSVLHNGWKELADRVEEVEGSMPENDKPVLASPYYWISSEMAYFLKDELAGYTIAFKVYENNVLGDDSTYTPWLPLDQLAGRDFIFVDERDNPDKGETPASFWEEKLPPYFDKVEGPTVFSVNRKGKEFRTFYIFKCYGFKGPDGSMDDLGAVKRYNSARPNGH